MLVYLVLSWNLIYSPYFILTIHSYALSPWIPFYLTNGLPFAVPLDLVPEDSTRDKSRVGVVVEDSPLDASVRPSYYGPLLLPNPSNVEVIYELAPDRSGFYIYERVNGHDIRPPSFISYKDYLKLHGDRFRTQYLRERAKQLEGTKDGSTEGGLIPPINVNSALFKDIFGSGRISIRPNVTILMDFSVRQNKIKNPNLTLRQQRNTTFNFDQKIQMGVNGQIGEKLKLRINYDTEAMFSFDNLFKTEYEGQEDDIIKKIEAGNVSLPLNNSLITGGQNLWGIKTQTQFGPVWITTVASQQRGKQQTITVQGGSQQTEFEIKAADYDYNCHFFLSHFFRSRYEQWLQNPPVVSSGINITRVEVWVTNRAYATTSNTRNAIGFVDLGENMEINGGVIYNDNKVVATGLYPSNYANNLYSQLLSGPFRNRATAVDSLEMLLGLRNGHDFELVENMRKLNENEYTVNRQLGYISLNTPLNPNDALFVAYEYTIAGSDSVYRVGEFSVDQPANSTNSNVLFLKMLKPPAIRPQLDNAPYPTWDLMMKNIYSVRASNLQPDGFNFQVVYEATDGSGDINYLPTSDVANKPLLQVFGLDRLRNNMDPGSDNRFDYIEGVTVNSNKGLIIFPVLDPFGSYLVSQFQNNREQDSTLYAFTPLYRMTPQDAVLYYPHLNRFKVKGVYKSATTSEIFLNAVQIVPGSVKVVAGGLTLQEGVDYAVDYNVGKVTILNPAVLNSGQQIKISFESNVLFGIQQKTLIGNRIDFKYLKDINIGATVVHLNERPLINKIRVGEEPVSNTVWGLDVNLKKQSSFLTRVLDRLPFYESETPSQILFQGEFAHFIPGYPKQIRQGDAHGTAYIDDFEGARYTIELMNRSDWTLASLPVPLSVPSSDPLAKGFTRAKLAWYNIDPQFYDNPKLFGYDNNSPTLNDPYTRRVSPLEVFPNRTTAGNNLLITFDLYYIPYRRGPYNYQTDPAKLNPDGTFKFPEENWAGIMRRTTGQTDFEAAGFQYIEFWLMDPFIKNANHRGGKLVFNLGRVSEDVLPDGRRAYENGLPTNEQDDAANVNLTLTPWGRVPEIQTPVMAFDNDPNARVYQDAGLDGLRSGPELTYFQNYVSALQNVITDQNELNRLLSDPGQDDYHHFSDPIYSSSNTILDRYLDFNGLEGNSPQTDPNAPFARAATTKPDVEDLNGDGTLNTVESYWEYVIDLRPSEMVVGKNFIVDKRTVTVELPNKTQTTATWYLFRIPLYQGKPVNGIQNFKAIDFMRLYLTEFKEEIVLRFGKFQLVAMNWRPYRDYLGSGTDGVVPEPDVNNTEFELATLNIEENGSKEPFNYVIPPAVERQQIPGSPITGLLQNEQSMVIRVCNLEDGDARAAFKNVSYDLRFYERFRLWFHLEPQMKVPDPHVSRCGDVVAFVRIGTDFVNNYYEYEMPLCPSRFGDQSPQNIWLNQMDVDLSELANAKFVRDQQVQLGNASYDQRFLYIAPDGSRIYVVGTPRLDQVKAIMVGIRNPKDDGLPICAEVWFNEMRVANFYRKPGWATTGRLNLQLADLGALSLSGNYSTPNFGTIEQKIQERFQEWRYQYDLAGNLQLHKLLPKSLGLEIPFYFTWGESRTIPRFHPYNPDILTRNALEILDPNQQSVQLTQWSTYRRTYSYMFNNVRKVRVPKPGQKQTPKSHLWDIQNFSFSYGYSRTDEHTPQIAQHVIEQYRGGITYQYSFNTKRWEPFKRIGKKPNLINQFHVSFLPKSIRASIEGTRNYEETVFRTIRGTVPIPPTYNQDFRITRTFGLQWNLTQSLLINFNATTVSRVDEPYGRIDTKEKRDSLLNNIFSVGRDVKNGKYHQINIGRELSYQHNLSVTYQLPFQFISPLNWISASTSYQATYQWQTTGLQTQQFGNTISNSRTIQGNLQMSFQSFYRKFKVIQEIMKPIPKKNLISLSDSSRKEGDEKEIARKRFIQGVTQFVLSLQDVRVSYSRNQQTLLPGYHPRPGLFGLYYYENDSLNVASWSPNWPFVIGDQPVLTPEGWFKEAREKGWITNYPLFATPFSQTDAEQINVNTLLTPFKDLNINLTFTRNWTRSNTGLFAFDSISQDFRLSNQMENGSYSLSYFTLNTAFERMKSQRTIDYLEREARKIISERLRESNPGYDRGPNPIKVGDYWNGYLGSSQEVLIPAFLSAYGPYSAHKVKLTAFPQIPLPNWDISFNGLSKIPLFEKLFKSVTIQHRYSCTYNFSYARNLKARDYDGDGFSDEINPITDTTGTGLINLYNYQPFLIIQTVTITEQFAPLVGVNIQFDNNMSLRLDFKKSRMASLNTGSLQINENRNNDISLAWSWRKQGMMKPISLFGKTIDLKNTINFRFETTLRNIRSFNRTLDSGIIQPTGGTFNLIIKPSIDYMINTQLTARVYFEKNINNPVLSTSYPTRFTAFGIQMRFTITQ